MARSVGGAAAEGIEAGFRMGSDYDAAQERKRAARVQETRQARADARAEEEFALRKKTDERNARRQGLADSLDLLDREQKTLGARQKELVGLSTAAQAAGGAVPAEAAEEYGRNSKRLAAARQKALDFFSRAQSGQFDPLDAEPGELYMNLTAATGMLPEDLAQMPQHIADIQAGLETGNQGLVVQGANGMLAPQLKVGVGGPSPHGGTIVRKEIIGLDPAPGGGTHFIPRVRVYVKTDKGDERYYDAPITKNRTSEDDDEVVTIDIAKAMDYMGNLGLLANAAQRPDMAERLAEGEKAAGAEARKYLEELTMLGRPTKKTTSRETTDLGNGVLERTVDASGNVVSERELPKGATPRMFRPPSGGSGSARGVLAAKLDEIDSMVESGEITPEEATEMRKAVVAGMKPAAAKPPTQTDVRGAVDAAVGVVADKMGLDYDATLKTYHNRDGTPITPEQKSRLGAARAAIQQKAQDAAAKGERVGASDLAPPAAPAKEKSKFEVGKEYRDSKGRVAVYQADGTWKVK